MPRVVTGKKEYIRTKYSDMFMSQFWKPIKVKEWPDGTVTYAFEWLGEDE